MGDNRYIVLPKRKLYLQVPRDANNTEELESLAKDILTLEEIAEESVIDTFDLKWPNVTLKEGAILVQTYDKVISLGNAMKLAGFFVIARMYDNGAYIVSDYDEKKMLTLERKGFTKIGFE